jgi:hypothetical protein
MDPLPKGSYYVEIKTRLSYHVADYPDNNGYDVADDSNKKGYDDINLQIPFVVG